MTTLPTAGKPIYYRDFIIVPVFILLQYTFPLLAEEVFPNLLERHFDYTLQPSGYNILFNVMMCLAQVIVIAIFMLLHRQHVVARIKTQLIGMRQHLWRIIIVYLLLVSFIFIYQRVIPPMTIQDDLITIPLSFVTIGILTPIVEELLFRHLIIGELGKKMGISMDGSRFYNCFWCSAFPSFYIDMDICPLYGWRDCDDIHLYRFRTQYFSCNSASHYD